MVNSSHIRSLELSVLDAHEELDRAEWLYATQVFLRKDRNSVPEHGAGPLAVAVGKAYERLLEARAESAAAGGDSLEFHVLDARRDLARAERVYGWNRQVSQHLAEQFAPVVVKARDRLRQLETLLKGH